MSAYPQKPTFPIDVRRGRRTKVSRIGAAISIDVEDGSIDNAALPPMRPLTLTGNVTADDAQPQDVNLSVLASAGNPIGDAIRSTPTEVIFPIYDGGAARNAVDRSRDWLVAADCGPSDGAATSDRACLTKAASLAQAADGAKSILVTRPFVSDDAFTIAPTVRLEGAGGLSKLSCLKPGGSIVNASQLFTIKHVLFDRIAGGADIAIKADDPAKAGYTRVIEECTFGSFPVCISSKNGQLLKVLKNTAIGTSGLFLDLAGANYGAEVSANNVLGLSGIRVGYSTIQCEGIRIADNEIFPIGDDGQFGIAIYGGLRINLRENLVGEIRPSCFGILLDGTTHQNVAIMLRDNWVGFRSEGPYAPNGIVVQGQNRAIRAVGNDIINVGVSVGAGSPQYIDGFEFIGNFLQGFPGPADGSGQLELRRILKGIVRDNQFDAATSGLSIKEYGVNRVAGDPSTFEMDIDIYDNYLARACQHLTHSRVYNNRGPGAKLQFPAYANDSEAASFGIPLGAFYRRSSDNGLVFRAA